MVRNRVLIIVIIMNIFNVCISNATSLSAFPSLVISNASRRDSNRQKYLYISKDQGKYWEKSSPSPDGIRILSHFLSKDNIIYFCGSDDTAPVASFVVFESQNQGLNWKGVRRLPDNMACGTSDDFFLTKNKIFANHYYTSKTDVLDRKHKVILNGKWAYVSFFGEYRGAALTTSCVYYTEDEGQNWQCIGRPPREWLGQKNDENKHLPPFANEKFVFINRDLIIYLHDHIMPDERPFYKQIVNMGGQFYYTNEFKGQKVKLPNGPFFYALDDRNFYLSMSNKVYYSDDGGVANQWTETHDQPWTNGCQFNNPVGVRCRNSQNRIR